MSASQRETVLITGSTGFIGQAVVERLLPNYDIIGLDRSEPEEPLPQNVWSVHMDVSSDESIQQALDEVERLGRGPIVSVVHLAAYVDFSGEPSPLYDTVTVEGTGRLLRALAGRPQLGVEQFIFSSTMLVHKGGRPGEPINEDAPLAGEWAYPESKIKTEQVIHDHRGDIPAVMLRIAGVYTDLCDSIPLAHQIQRIYEERLTARVFPGDVSHGQSFVHIEDLTRAFELAIQKRRDLPGEVAILIGEPETYSYDRLQHEIARLIHGDPDWRTEEIPKLLAKSGAWVQDQIDEAVPGLEDPFIKPFMIDIADDHYQLDISRARDLLGWEPQHRLIDTLPSMIDELKADPEDWYARHGL